MRYKYIALLLLAALITSCKDETLLGSVFPEKIDEPFSVVEFIESGVKTPLDEKFLSKKWAVTVFDDSGEFYDKEQLIDFSSPENDLNTLKFYPFFSYSAKIYSEFIPSKDVFYISNAPIGELIYGDELKNESPYNRFNLKLKWFFWEDVDGNPFLDIYSSWHLYPSCVGENESECANSNLNRQPRSSSERFPIIASDKNNFAVKKNEIFVVFQDASQ